MTRACVLLVDEPELLTLLEMTLARMDLDTEAAGGRAHSGGRRQTCV